MTPRALACRFGPPLVLLVVEALVLLTSFSTARLQESEHPLVLALGSLWLVPKAAVPVLAAVLLFGKERLRDELALLVAGERPHRGWTLLHVALFGALYAVSVPFLRHGDEFWLGPWLALVAATGASALPLLARPRRLAESLRRNAGVLGGAAAIGALAFLAGRYSTSGLWEPLRVSTLAVVYEILTWIADDTVIDADAFVLGTERFGCRISPECSGFEGIGLISVFLGSALWLFREHLRFPRAWLLLLIGVVVIWLANALRIVALIAIGSWISPRLAVEGFHSIAGITSFCVIGLGMLAFARRSPWFSRSVPESGTNWTAVYLSPFLLAVAVAMLAGAFSSGLDTLYPLRPVAVAGLLFLWRDRLPSVSWRLRPGAVGIGVLAFVIWMAALRIRDGAPTEVGVQSEWDALPAGWAAFWLVFRVAGTVWMAPWTEELAFRGYLMRRLTDPEFERVAWSRAAPVALVVSSLMFGVTHHYWVAATLCGALYAWAQLRGRSLSDAVQAHAVTNGLLVVYALATGNWSVWL